jgi:hypothetical protein
MTPEMMEQHAKMKGMMSQVIDIMTEMQGMMDGVVGEEQPSEEMKMKEKEEYLNKPPEEKEKIDKKSVLGKKSIMI